MSNNLLVSLPKAVWAGDWFSEIKVNPYPLLFSIRIQTLSAFENELTFVPASLLQIPTLRKLNLSRNKITSLSGDPNDDSEENANMTDGETWGCTALKVLSLSNNKLQHLPRGIQGAVGLTKLLVDHNDLRDFPMPWKCPLVSQLKYVVQAVVGVVVLANVDILARVFCPCYVCPLAEYVNALFNSN